MKRCPECGRTFADDSLRFCPNDSRPLVEERQAAPPSFAFGATPSGRKPVQWRWIIRAVIAAVFLIRLGLHGFHSQTPSPSATTPSQPGTTLSPPDAALRTRLTTAVRQGDAAEAQAFRSGSPAPLHSSYSGPALAGEINNLQALKRARTTRDERLVSQNFTSYRVNADRSEAQVDVTETWSTTTYSTPGHKIVSTVPSQVVPQTVYLRPSGSGWIVENIQINTR